MEKKHENMSLQEATIKALYNELDDSDEIKDVEGIVDDVLVITDPEITKDEYEEVIDRAQEIVEDTPEGDIPFDEDYIGQYLQTCPICGSSFVEDHLLEPGATCPICLEQPDAFVVVGKIDSDVAVEEELGLGDEEGIEDEFDNGNEYDLGNEEVEDLTTEEPIPESEEEPNENFERSGGRRASNLRLGRDVASKEIPSGNILAESKSDVDDWGKYYVKCFNDAGTDMDTIGFDNEADACEYADKHTKNNEYKEIGVYDTETDECLYLYGKDNLKESRYKVSSYYDLKYQGLEDSLETDDYDEAKNFVWDKVQKGGAVELVDTETGDRKRFVSKTSEQDETATDIEDYEDKIYSHRVSFISKWKDYTDFICNWCGTTFKGSIDSYGRMPMCPHCLEDRYADDEDGLEDGHANKDVHFLNVENEEPIYTDFSGNVITEGKTVGDDISELISAVKTAIGKYDLDNISVDEDEEDGTISVMFTSDNNSFQISNKKWLKKNIDVEKLISELDSLNIGYCLDENKNGFENERRLMEGPEDGDEEFEKLCREIRFQAEENDFTLSEDAIKDVARQMIADSFFFNHDIFTDDGDEYTWEEINYLIVSAIEKYLKKNESNNIKTENKIVIDNMGETYTIDTDAETYTIKTPRGEKTFPFEKMDEFVKGYRGVNRLHKPMSVLAYTDYKNGALRNWNVSSGGELTESVVPDNRDSFNINLTDNGEKVARVNIKGLSKPTEMIKTALKTRFAGKLKSDVTGKVYTQDIYVADDLWLEFMYYDEGSNTFVFKLDGDITNDTEIMDAMAKKTESVDSKEYDDILVAIENATSIDELQDIIYAVSDGTVEDEMQSMYDTCIKDKDDLDVVKSLLSNIFEDNIEVLDDELTENISPLSDTDKINYYYGTVRNAIPFTVYKIKDKFYDGNGIEIDKTEVDNFDFFEEK